MHMQSSYARYVSMTKCTSVTKYDVLGIYASMTKYDKID